MRCICINQGHQIFLKPALVKDAIANNVNTILVIKIKTLLMGGAMGVIVQFSYCTASCVDEMYIWTSIGAYKS